MVMLANLNFSSVQAVSGSKFWQQTITGYLEKEGLIDDNFIKMLMAWQRVSGFNIRNEVRIESDDDKGMENLSQYIIRNTFSLEKLKYDDGDTSVI